MLCKCMNLDKQCKHKHWADLSEEEQKQLEAQWDREDKAWPPTSMETK